MSYPPFVFQWLQILGGFDRPFPLIMMAAVAE
jgi:hypothetical protein